MGRAVAHVGTVGAVRTDRVIPGHALQDRGGHVCALEKFVPLRSVPVSSTLLRLAAPKFAFVRFALIKFIPLRFEWIISWRTRPCDWLKACSKLTIDRSCRV